MLRSADTATRKPLADMEPEELRTWLVERRTRLVTHKQFVRRYLSRRRVRRHGRQTYADRQYYRFQALADDLLDGVMNNIDQQIQCAASEKESTP